MKKKKKKKKKERRRNKMVRKAVEAEEERNKKRRASRRRGREGEKERERERERKKDADGIISNAPQHVAPVSPPPGCQTCFFLCAIVSKAKVQHERGCRAYHEILSTDFSSSQK